MKPKKSPITGGGSIKRIGGSSLFGQLVCVIDRLKFESLVARHQSDRGSKGLRIWDQLIAMLFCQLAQARSLREIAGGLLCYESKLGHLGMNQVPKRSTLSYANAVHIQIWTALISLLLLRLLQFRSKMDWALSNLVALLRWNLFTYRNLWTWIDHPFDTPHQPPDPGQLNLVLDGIHPYPGGLQT
jgi:hypothetical protein